MSIKTAFKLFNLTVSAILVVCALFLAYVAIPQFGNKALIVRSGSMQPAIGVGDLVVVRANDRFAVPAPGLFPKYRVGDVVAFSGQKDAKTITTHRVAEVKAQDNKIFYATKGDANKTPDQNLVAEDKIIGKSSFKIAGLGKLFAVAKTRNGFLALVMIPAVLVIIFELLNIAREINKGRRKENSILSLSQSESDNPENIILRLLIPFVVGTMFFQNSFASYADSETSSGNVLEAAESFSEPDLRSTQEELPTGSPSPSPTPIATPSPSPEVTVGE